VLEALSKLIGAAISALGPVGVSNGELHELLKAIAIQCRNWKAGKTWMVSNNIYKFRMCHVLSNGIYTSQV